MRNVLVGLSMFVLIGCGSRQESPDAQLPPNRDDEPMGRATADYEVHEWGLLRADARDVLEAGAISPPGSIVPMAVDKPVLYFHAKAPLQLERIRVDAVGGTVREHWPLTTTESFPTSIEWSDVRLDAAQTVGGGSCGGRFPSASERPCSDLGNDEPCESLELATVVSPSATCLQSEENRWPFLFYRSRTATFTPPLTVNALPSGELRLTNNGDEPIPGWVVRMQRNGEQVRALAVRAPGAGETATVGRDFANAVVPTASSSASDEDPNHDGDAPALPGSEEPGRQAIRLTLGEIGLDDGEIEAFLRAWDGTLFGDRIVPVVDPDRNTASDRHGALDGIPVDVLTDDQMMVSDSILYFLPEAACSGVSRLSLTPAPTRLVRALALWQLVR